MWDPLDFSFALSSCVKVIQSCPTLCNTMDYTAHGILQARILEWVVFPFSRGSSQPRDQTQVSHLQEDSLPAEPQGKPKNIGGSSLSLLQWIFPIQESNRGLLHCRRILYQLSYQGSPLLRHGMCQSLRQWYYQHCWNQAGPCGVSGYRSFFVPCIFLDYWK